MSEELKNKIQSLVDGELSSHRRQELLLELEKCYPEHWRTLALGFIEGQVIRDALIARKNPKKVRTVFPAFLRMAAILAVGIFLGVFFSKQQQPQTPGETASALPSEPATPEEEVVEIAQSRIDRISEAVSEHGFNPVIERTLIEADLGEGRRLIIPLNRLLIASND